MATSAGVLTDWSASTIGVTDLLTHAIPAISSAGTGCSTMVNPSAVNCSITRIAVGRIVSAVEIGGEFHAVATASRTALNAS